MNPCFVDPWIETLKPISELRRIAIRCDDLSALHGMDTWQDRECLHQLAKQQLLGRIDRQQEIQAGQTRPRESTRCPRCLRLSHNPHDIVHHYGDYCHTYYHD